MIVRDLQTVIGREGAAQMLEQTGKLPTGFWPASVGSRTHPHFPSICGRPGVS